MKKTIILIVVAVFVIWGAYVFLGSRGGQEAGSFKVGVLLPLSGDAASYGEAARNVYQLAAEEINNAGGMGGQKIELVIEDSKCNGKDATNAAQKLVNVDKVQIILGGFCSSESLAAVPVAQAAKVAIFSPGSSSPDLTGISPYFFRVFPSDASQGSLDAEVAYKLGYRTVAFMQEQIDYPLGIYKAFTRRFEELGGKTTKEEFPSNATDFRSQLLKLRAQNPDALFIDPQTSANTQRILKQMQDIKWKPKLFINEATAGDQKALSDNKNLLEGAIGAEFRTNLANAKFQHLLDAYKNKYGVDLPYQSYGQTAYDTVYIARDGILAVGYNGEKFANWSRTIKDWDGASGKVTIKSDGDRESGYTSEVVRNGKMELYTK